MELTPMTELEAVNEILASIGESPLNTLENLTDIDGINAYRILKNINRQFQSRGWSFNRNESYVLNPDSDTNKILWLDTLLFIKDSNGTKYVKKGKYLYDLTNQTDTFKAPVTVEVILLTEFEDMPDAARSYIVAKASTEFSMKYLGDDGLLQGLRAREQEAWSYFNEYELDNNNYNMLENTYISGVKER